MAINNRDLLSDKLKNLNKALQALRNEIEKDPNSSSCLTSIDALQEALNKAVSPEEMLAALQDFEQKFKGLSAQSQQNNALKKAIGRVARCAGATAGFLTGITSGAATGLLTAYLINNFNLMRTTAAFFFRNQTRNDVPPQIPPASSTATINKRQTRRDMQPETPHTPTNRH